MKVAVISDTHGKLRSDVTAGIVGCDLVLHAGDFDTEDVYRQLEQLGPTLAGVRGNCDWWAYGGQLPESRYMKLEGVRVLMTHRPQDVWQYREQQPSEIIIHGHTHCYLEEMVGETLWLNPGSVSEPRGTGYSYALLYIEDGQYRVERVSLPDREPDRARTDKVNAAKPLKEMPADGIMTKMGM